MAYNKPYVYDKGQFMAVARTLGGRSVGICIPDALRREHGIRPGTRVICKIRVVTDEDGGEGGL